MKKLISVFVIALLVLVSSCKKGEVPSNCKKFVGTWNSVSSYGSQYQLIIKDNGQAEYYETNAGSYKKVTGGIYFEGYNFKIGTNNINKKFKTDQVPTRVTTSTNPYTFYQTASFNGVAYTDKN